MNPNAQPDIYPLATREGRQIRNDVKRAGTVTNLAVTLAAEALYLLAGDARLLEFTCTNLVQIAFDINGTTSAKSRGIVVLPADRTLVQIPADVTTIYARALVANCNLHIHEILPWHGLTTAEATQYS